ncbi:hypothetical protein Mal52_58340 [Symmachiella dynata]|uniref:Uncharacterized protein n=1 Tax=Symmachiella dynata TaxID=2527995 RepID=A0A517ZXZ1_9PLAN|nr:hypothetical protein [Symmachiella dynata]QDU47306.1 hypothetical protein Mal52_58340 [Symmachiella dynata]
MEETTTATVDDYGNPIPVHPIQVHLARIIVVAAFVMIIALQFSGTPPVNVATKGDSTVYTENLSSKLPFIIFPVLTGIGAFVFALQPGIYRFFSVALVAITAWMAFNTFDIVSSNHNVTLTPTRVTREVGTKAKPIRHSIDFTKTAYLYIDQVPGSREPKHELVAIAADGAETRVPISGMMRFALPQILETASQRYIIIGMSENGSAIPDALQRDLSK